MLMTLILNSHIFYDLIYVRYACIVFLMMMMMMMRMSIVEKIWKYPSLGLENIVFFCNTLLEIF